MGKVSVEQHVQQVLDGSHYKGYLKIGNARFDYELVFGIPIEQLDSMGPAKDEDEVRRLFQITVKRDDTNIELTKEEYGFFFSMVVEFAIDFYCNPQTRNSQEGIIGLMLQGADIFGTQVSIGMTSSGLYDFPTEVCEMLSSPKFDCVLATT